MPKNISTKIRWSNLNGVIGERDKKNVQRSKKEERKKGDERMVKKKRKRTTDEICDIEK